MTGVKLPLGSTLGYKLTGMRVNLLVEAYPTDINGFFRSTGTLKLTWVPVTLYKLRSIPMWRLRKTLR